ncbi:MAG: 50S ribosomal protein L35 [Clostridia bacterium]|jgi:large subunit ribosomal protein L35|nr:50S ribosomal protein L35 [Clostridia bacterium]MBO7360992.1 50S ribosomal protein L35 [Clostridia bacterium]MCR4682500.1 50S ribosomal protein L35 [Clostridiales bacterium]
MGKIKTHRASAKRFDVTAGGKVKMNHSHHRHKLGLKDQKRKRHLRSSDFVQGKMASNIRRLIGK